MKTEQQISKIQTCLVFLRRKLGDVKFSNEDIMFHANDLFKKGMSPDEVKQACLYFENSFEPDPWGKKFPSIADFLKRKHIEFRKKNKQVVIKPDDWKVEASKKLGIPVKEIPDHTADLTHEQRDILDICHPEDARKILRDCINKL